MPGPPKSTTASARKRTRAAQARQRRAHTINIGTNIDAWNAFMENEGCKNNDEAAKLLLDSYSATKEKRKRTKLLSSTPGIPPSDVLSGLSSISSIRSDRFSEMSGVEMLSESSQSETDTRKLVESQKVQDVVPDINKSASIRIEEITFSDDDAGAIDDIDDETYVPSQWEMSFDVPNPNLENLQILEVDQDINAEVHDFDNGENEEEVVQEPNVQKLQSIDSDKMKDQMYIASESCIVSLARTLLTKCSTCQQDVDIQTKKNGSGIILNWVCSRGHVCKTWSSQPMLRHGVLLGNMKFAASITLSGNNYTKVALMCKFMNLGLPSSANFLRIQSHYVVPAVNTFWETTKQTAKEEVRALNVVIAGDGRMDSPGHCAKYCTYTVMDQRTKKILAMEVVDKRECQLKSAVLEATAFKRAMTDLEQAGVRVVECVTDAHPQISKIMRQDFPAVQHSWDMWHGAKNFGKKLCAISQERGNSAIKPWISDISNHFYYSAETCQGDAMVLTTKLVSILNHCANRHEWALGQCAHEEIDEDRGDKKWLSTTGPELKALEKVVTNDRFLGTMKYYVTCQTTSELEYFNNHILMYASKRQSFTYSVYRCRSHLAAIDYMLHHDRPYRVNKKGEQCFSRTFSKATNHWRVKPIKVKKEYTYIKTLLIDIIQTYLSKDRPLSHAVEPLLEDPGRLIRTIAPVDPPPTQQLIEEQQSRLKANWPKPGTSSEK